MTSYKNNEYLMKGKCSKFDVRCGKMKFKGIYYARFNVDSKNIMFCWQNYNFQEAISENLRKLAKSKLIYCYTS